MLELFRSSPTRVVIMKDVIDPASTLPIVLDWPSWRSLVTAPSTISMTLDSSRKFVTPSSSTVPVALDPY